MALSFNSSLVEYFGQGDGHSCGYCKSKDTNFSYGMWGHVVNVSDYQDLIDRGWRRSGCYLYRPQLNIQCCPMYTIKCDAINFKLSSSHKRVIKNVNRYLNFDIKPKNYATGEDYPEPEKGKMKDSSDSVFKTKHVPRPGLGQDVDKPQCRKAKLIRTEKKNEKLMKKNEKGDDGSIIAPSKLSNSSKSLEQYLNDVVDNPIHKLRIELIRSDSENERHLLSTSHSIYEKYQMTIHKDKPSDVRPDQFKRFLIKSALNTPESSKHGHPGFGSFHQRYWIDDKLVAVGVIDILPKCISSVYLFYDPEFNFLSLGTYAALREIEFVRKLHLIDEGMSSYYMGFYIHSCPKMKYKGQFHPSYLLCPETFTWHPIDECLPLLNSNKYSRFASPGTVDEEVINSNERDVLVWCRGSIMTCSQYLKHDPDKSNLEKAKEYARLVGKRLAERMLLVRS